MASKLVIDAVAAKLATVWAGIAPAIPIFAPNDTGIVPSDGTAFLTYEFWLPNEQQITIGARGSNVFREEGVLRLILSAPRGQGTDPWAGYMDSLRAAFRSTTIATAGSTSITTYGAAPPVLDSRSDRGAYFEFSIAIEFYLDVFS